MHEPRLTIGLLPWLVLVYAVLALVVVALRVRSDVPYGDGGNVWLLRAVRAHGNFAEWVPITVVLVGALEAVSGSSPRIRLMMAALLVARVLHPIALFSPVGSPQYLIGRIGGAFVTWTVMTAAAVLVLIE